MPTHTTPHAAYDHFIGSLAFVAMPLAARLNTLDAATASAHGFPHVARFHLQEAVKACLNAGIGTRRTGSLA